MKLTDSVNLFAACGNFYIAGKTDSVASLGIGFFSMLLVLHSIFELRRV